jgi:nucleoid-associated protein YgaU
MTTQVKKAIVYVEWQDPNAEPKQIEVQYNPTEYSIDTQVTIGEVAIPGIEMPLQQFVRGNAEKLTLDLFFDTTEHGTGKGAVSVTTETDKIYQLIKIEPKRHAPPILTFVWSDSFPGSSVGGAPGAVAGAAAGSVAGSALAAASASLGNQRRNGFRCVMEQIKQKFTLFSPDGVPLRATLSVTLREYETLEDQLKRLNLSSPDRTHAHVVEQGDALDSIAKRYYDRPNAWRAIADQNSISDPRRLMPGKVLQIPPLA